jgi:hypothetical protein
MNKTLLLASLLVSFASTPALAYLGPGAGLGMIGSLIAVILVASVIVLGLVIYPIRLMRKRRASAIGAPDSPKAG